MNDTTYNLLFICTHNSARSIMAESIMNSSANPRFRAFSAGSRPSGVVHPMALETLGALRLETAGLRSKDWSEFARPDAPALDFVFTVCDQAAGEACPVWPGQPMTAHWGMADPAAFNGSEDATRKLFRETAIVLNRRIELMMSLPLASLDRLSIQREISTIGTR